MKIQTSPHKSCICHTPLLSKSLAILILSLFVLQSCKKEETREEINLLYSEITENWSITSTTFEGPKLIFPVDNGFIGLEYSGKVSLFDLESGSPVWTFQSIGIDPNIDNRFGLIKDNVFYFVSNSYSLYALDINTGNKLWSIDLDQNSPVSFSNVLKLGYDGRLYTAIEQIQPSWETFIISMDLNGQNIDTIHTMKLGNTMAKVIDIAGEKDYFRILYQEFSGAANSPVSFRLVTSIGHIEFRALEYDGGTVPTSKIKFIHRENNDDYVQINNRLYIFWRGLDFRRVGFERLYDAMSDGQHVYAFHSGSNTLQRGIHTFNLENLTPISQITSVANQSFFVHNPLFVSPHDEKIIFHTTVPQTEFSFFGRYGIKVFDLKTQEQKVFYLGNYSQAALAVDTVNKVFYTRDQERFYQVSY